MARHNATALRPTSITLVCVLVLVALPGSLAAGVSQLSGFSSTGQDMVTVSGTGSSRINNAISYWQACGTLGQELPSMSAGSGGDVHVTVIYNSGQHGANCGTFTPGNTNASATIELWDTSSTSSGSTYQCNVDDTLAHELGHVLGLANSTCSGHMMAAPNISNQNGTLVADPRAPQAGECSMVDSNWFTTWEQNQVPDPENPRDHGPCGV